MPTMASNPYHSAPRAPHRKPLPAPPPNSFPLPLAPENYRQPVYGSDGVSLSNGLGITATAPPLPLTHDLPPPPPPKGPETHARKSSFPTLLKKMNKSPASQPLPLPPTIVPMATTATTQPSPLSERQTRERRRSLTPPRVPSDGKLQSNRLQPRDVSPSPVLRGRSSSAQPPRARQASTDAPRVVSNPNHARSLSKNSSDGDGSPSGTGKARKGWLRGGRSRSNSIDLGKDKGTSAWIMTPGSRADYNSAPLINGEKVPELWSEPGSVSVFLYPKESGRGPSFKVADHVFGSSRVLNELMLSETIWNSSRGLSADDATTRRQPVAPGGGRLYLPLPKTDLDSLVAARNLFALLTNQPLVGTRAHPTIFAAILQISALLQGFGFSNFDGTSFGDDVDATIDLFVDQFGLGDVRHSREKTIEALILAEHMKSWNLYNEAFTHAAGKYDDIVDLNSPLFSKVTSNTRNRLERAHLDLTNREHNVDLRLESFEFPSLFAGIASSTSREEYKSVKFKEWRNSFAKMRSFVLSYYKDLFGNWPPKAKSKKNHFSRGGLNRQCLKMLYSDVCALYDLLVDRESLTPRAIDQLFEEADGINPSISALRKVLSEFDHSSPPVLPPIPYDVPKLPSMTAIHANYNSLPAKQQAKFDKQLQSNELLLMLIKSHNIDTDALRLPFLVAFKDFELREARGVPPQDLADQRIGYWLFLYVVIQSLPMLVVDAPGLNWTEGVEYFLSQAPQGNPPWVEDAGQVRKMWYQTAGQGIVELSADVIMFSVEGIYMRSHCWLAAKEWERAAGTGPGVVSAPPPPPIEIGASPLAPPMAVFQDMDPVAVASGTGSAPGSPQSLPRNRNASPSGRARHAYRSSIAMGLEPIPLDGMGNPIGDRSSRVASAGSRPGSSSGGPGGHQLGQRSVSIGNLSLAASEQSVPANAVGSLPPARRSSPNQGLGHGSSGSTGGGSVGGSTFDDILKGMEKDKSKKKRSFF